MSEPLLPRWLLLAHHLPARPSNARVKTWRRLLQLGAVPARNSVYVLPNSDQAREDLEWIRKEILSMGGEATVFAAEVLGGEGEVELVATFQRAREADYHALHEESEMLVRKKRQLARDRDAVARTARSMRDRLASIEKIDFFGAPGRAQAVEAIARLERLASNGAVPPNALRLKASDFQKRRWVTRPRPGVDRMASAWLIRRHIDPKATFTFADRLQSGEIAFDMYACEFGHHGAQCTFETLCQRFGIRDTAVVRIGQIVHDLDLKEIRFAPPEAPAVDRMIEGLRQMYADDLTQLEQAIRMFDALSRSFAHDRRTR
jgi:hypothetical protein